MAERLQLHVRNIAGYGPMISVDQLPPAVVERLRSDNVAIVDGTTYYSAHDVNRVLR